MRWCYEVFFKDRKLKNIFEKIIYKMWLMCGVRSSALLSYLFERDMWKIDKEFKINEKKKIQNNKK